MQTLPSTPKADGYRMPGEFEPHDMCWMIWPERPDVWRNGAKPAQEAYTEVAKAIARFEPVTILASADQYRNARHRLPDHIRVIEMSSNDAWLRDSGPTFLINNQGGLRAVDWWFNAYGGLNGGLYFPWDKDLMLAQKMCEVVGIDRYQAPLVYEGGSITVDGEGTLLTTSDCILNDNRNPEKSVEEVEKILRDYLAVEKIIWLRCDIGEETDGHIDQLCCFARPGEIILGWTDDPESPYYPFVREAEEILSNTTDAKGRPFKIHKLPFPEPIYLTEEEASTIELDDFSFSREAGMPIADSYINFYIANGGIIMPSFDQPTDLEAAEILSDIFPEREVVMVPGREIGIGGGLVHCITQQQPRR